MFDENTFLTDRQLVSILVPCYNEEAVLHEFYRRTVQIIDGISRYDFQFMFVNDGSRDHTLDIMRELHEEDSRVSYVNLLRNFGKEIVRQGNRYDCWHRLFDGRCGDYYGCRFARSAGIDSRNDFLVGERLSGCQC